MTDARRGTPRTDEVLADSRFAGYERAAARRAVAEAQERCRRGEIGPDDVVEVALDALPRGMAEVLNATGVVLHTNLGRAPLSEEARRAVDRAARGYVDVELDLATGERARRGRGVEAALRTAVPDAEAALVVNNGAAALVLAALVAGDGKSVVVSRGELVEIGDGFRLTSILGAAGVRLTEVGATNRTTLADYRGALGPDAGAILKVHPSNFHIEGFTSSVALHDLRGLRIPVVADLGSGLLRPDPLLPGEPDATTALRDGADVVTFSGDKLLGGPQAGIALGSATTIERMRRHPLARAFRVDKLTLAALEATLTHGDPPIARMLTADVSGRVRALVERIDGAEYVETQVPLGGGSGPGVTIASAAVGLPEAYAEPLRTGTPAVLGRMHKGRLLLDLRAVPPERDAHLLAAVRACSS